MIQERAKEFAIIESIDGGKPIRESRDVDIPLAASHFFYYAGWADKLEYAFPNKTPKPIGVAGQIIPWNFPLLMAAWKIAPAIACGNTVVLKPAETTSLTALKLAEVIQESGLPKGVVNIVTGAGKTGSEIVNHPEIDKIAFTGSTQVGKLIQNSIVGTQKKSTLELGGKGANIIFEDAAIDQAVEGIINAIFFNQGHVCCAGSRLASAPSLRALLAACSSSTFGSPRRGGGKCTAAHARVAEPASWPPTDRRGRRTGGTRGGGGGGGGERFLLLMFQHTGQPAQSPKVPQVVIVPRRVAIPRRLPG